MTISEYIDRNGSGSFPSDTRTVVSLVRQSIVADNLKFSTELELQDLIYNSTHNVHFTSMARPIFDAYTKSKALSDWNDSTCLPIVQDGATHE